MRCGLATTLLWIGALKFKDYEVQNAEVLVTASPLTSRLREKLGAQKLARLIGVTQITLGSLIAAKPVAPRASAAGSFGAAGMMLGTLSFLATTPEAWQEGAGRAAAVHAGRGPVEGHRAPRRRPSDGCRVAASRSRPVVGRRAIRASHLYPAITALWETVTAITDYMDPALRSPLRHVYWLGGGSGAGKSTIARRLAVGMACGCSRLTMRCRITLAGPHRQQPVPARVRGDGHGRAMGAPIGRKPCWRRSTGSAARASI